MKKFRMLQWMGHRETRAVSWCILRSAQFIKGNQETRYEMGGAVIRWRSGNDENKIPYWSAININPFYQGEYWSRKSRDVDSVIPQHVCFEEHEWNAVIRKKTKNEDARHLLSGGWTCRRQGQHPRRSSRILASSYISAAYTPCGTPRITLSPAQLAVSR